VTLAALTVATLSGKVGWPPQALRLLQHQPTKGENMIFTSHKQLQAQQQSEALRELNLDELRAVTGGIFVQNTRPDPVIYPVIQNNTP
jgi:hypothetical protein